MERLKMLWWLLTKKDICMVVRDGWVKNDYDYETTTSRKDTVIMTARLFQYCYCALYRKEMSINRIFNVYIPKEEE